jgi:hypothetical protein
MFQDFKELLFASNVHNVRYLIVGEYAVPDGNTPGDGRGEIVSLETATRARSGCRATGSRRRRR